MRTKRPPVLFLLWFLALGTFAAAQEELVTGPPDGTSVSPVRCYANSGPNAGREEFDVIREIGAGPGALLFIHVLNRNTVPVIRGLDNLGRELGAFGFEVFPIRLIEDRTAGEEELLRVNGSLKLHSPIVLSLDGLDGPGNYALNRRCTLSLILLNGAKVQESIAYIDTGMADLPVLREKIEAMMGGIPHENEEALMEMATAALPKEDAALRAQAVRQAVELYRVRREQSVEFESGPRYPGRGQPAPRMRGGEMKGKKAPAADASPKEAKAKPSGADTPTAPDQKREGKPPEDAQLSSLLRAFIRKTNDDAAADEVYQEITARGAESEELGSQVKEMFQLMLSYPDRYGTEHAQELARRFLQEKSESKPGGT